MKSQFSKPCVTCDNVFYKKSNVSKKTWIESTKYCSLMCRSAQRKGTNFVTKGSFKKGMIPWNKGKNGVLPSGDKHHNWKEKPSYHALHSWVKRHKGRPEHCSQCEEKGKYNGRKWSIHWANIDNKYRRNLDDFIPLCVQCHVNFDIKYNGKYQR